MEQDDETNTEVPPLRPEHLRAPLVWQNLHLHRTNSREREPGNLGWPTALDAPEAQGRTLDAPPILVGAARSAADWPMHQCLSFNILPPSPLDRNQQDKPVQACARERRL